MSCSRPVPPTAGTDGVLSPCGRKSPANAGVTGELAEEGKVHHEPLDPDHGAGRRAGHPNALHGRRGEVRGGDPMPRLQVVQFLQALREAGRNLRSLRPGQPERFSRAPREVRSVAFSRTSLLALLLGLAVASGTWAADLPLVRHIGSVRPNHYDVVDVVAWADYDIGHYALLRLNTSPRQMGVQVFTEEIVKLAPFELNRMIAALKEAMKGPTDGTSRQLVARVVEDDRPVYVFACTAPSGSWVQLRVGESWSQNGFEIGLTNASTSSVIRLLAQALEVLNSCPPPRDRC